MKRWSITVLTAITVMALVSMIPVTTSAASLRLNNKKIVLVKGETAKLKVKGTKTSRLKWRSSAPKVAKVSKSGRVTAKKAGKAIVYAKAGNKQLRCKVTVENPRISKTSLQLNIGDSYRLKMTGTKQKVRWSVKNNKVATVTKNGVIRAKKTGKTSVYARIGKKKYLCRLIVNTKESGSKNDGDTTGKKNSRKEIGTKTTTEVIRKEENNKPADTIITIEPTKEQDGIKQKTITQPAGCKYRYTITNYNTDSIYDYELRMLNNPNYHLYTYGSNVTAQAIFFIKTENQDYDGIEIRTGVLDEALDECSAFDDIYYLERLQDRGNDKAKARNGWAFTTVYNTTGIKTIQIYETLNGRKTLVSEAIFEVEDGNTGRDVWIQSVIDEVINDHMTVYDKAKAIEAYIKKNFIYLRSDSLAYRDARFFTFDVGPVWETKIVDCGTASVQFEMLLDKLGIENEYVPKSHGDIKITDGDRTYIMNACPTEKTGVINFSWDFIN